MIVSASHLQITCKPVILIMTTLWQPASAMPLEMASTAAKTAVLCQSTDPKLDMKGDVGIVGRIKVDKKADRMVQIDLNGVEYAGNLFSCHSLCVVSVGTKTDAEGNKSDNAKIETVLNEVVQLERAGDVFSKETTTGGSISGYDMNDGDDGGFKGWRQSKDDSDDEGASKKKKPKSAAKKKK